MRPTPNRPSKDHRAARLALAIFASCSSAPGASGDARGPAEAQAETLADWRVFTTEDGLPSDSVRALRRFGDRLWVGTDAGLAMLEGDRWRSWTGAEGLPWPAISAIAVDPATHDVWLGTFGGGLVRFSAGRFDRFNQFNSGLAGDLVFAVEVAGRRIFAATNSGVSAFDWAAGTWDLHLERRADAPETAVTSLAWNGAGGLYAAAWGEGLWLLDGLGTGSDRRVALPDAGEETAMGIAAAQGRLWVHTPSGLWCLRPDGTWTARRRPADLPGVPRCVSVSDPGGTWLGAGSSLLNLASRESDDWVRYDFAPEDGVAGIRIRSIRSGRGAEVGVLPATAPQGGMRCLASGEGEVWVGTPHGLLGGRARARAGDSAVRAAVRPIAATDAMSAPAEGSVVLELLGPISRTVFLPGTHEPGSSRARADFDAAQLAADGLCAGASSRARRSVEIRQESTGFYPYAWGTPEDEIVDVLRKHAPAAFVGCIEPGQRVSSAVTLFTEIPFVNTSLLPPALHEQASPWIFRCRIDDPREEARVMDFVLDSLDCRRPAILRTGDAFADMHLDAWKARALERGSPPVAEVSAAPEGQDPSDLVSELRASDADVLLTWCDERTTADLVRQMREQGIHVPVVGSDRIVVASFLARAGGNAGLVVAPQPCPHRLDAAAEAQFVEGYASGRYAKGVRGGPPPSAWATYHAVRHVVEAADVGGVEPGALRRALQERSRCRIARVVAGHWEVVSGDDR